MKNTLLLGIGLFTIVSCSNPSSDNQNTEANTEEMTAQDSWSTFGDTIDNSDLVTFASVQKMVSESGEAQVKISGDIEETCQKKGCWVKVKVEGSEQPIRVTFKDYGFFVPLNSNGKQTVLSGRAYYDTVDVETLRHFAEDAGKTEEEIMKINEPEMSLAFEANGVLIKDDNI
jgi:hypothetical protein